MATACCEVFLGDHLCENGVWRLFTSIVSVDVSLTHTVNDWLQLVSSKCRQIQFDAQEAGQFKISKI
jgi:hypothetical protein